MLARYAHCLTCGLLAAALSWGAASAAEQGALSKDQVLQKIRFARMLATQSKLSYRLSHSDDARAHHMLDRARDAVKASQKALDGGDLDQAARDVDEGIHLMTQAAHRLPKQGASGDHGLQYKELLDTVTTFKASYDRNYRRMVKAKGEGAVGRPLDEKKFQFLVDRARSDAKRGELDKANRVLAVAERQITEALSVLLKGQTLVYGKHFDSPRQQYRYEAQRHDSYANLVPEAVKKHDTTARARELIKQFVGLSDSMTSHAQKQAHGGDYQGAIKTMQAATSQLQRALWIAGVRWSRWPE